MKPAYLLLAALSVVTVATGASAREPDPNFHIYLCFGQSNMEGFPGVEQQDKTEDERFQVLAAVDFPKLGRKKGSWYPAVPPLCRESAGLGPADYFGRTLVAHLPKEIRVGVVNVSVAGCKIELFDTTTYEAYAATAPPWMANIIKGYGGNPYARLVEMAKLAQKDGVIKGILLHQGESNTNDKQWPEKVKAIYNNLLKDLNCESRFPALARGRSRECRSGWRLCEHEFDHRRAAEGNSQCPCHPFRRLQEPPGPPAFHRGGLQGAGEAIRREDALVAGPQDPRAQGAGNTEPTPWNGRIVILAELPATGLKRSAVTVSGPIVSFALTPGAAPGRTRRPSSPEARGVGQAGPWRGAGDGADDHER